MTAGASTAGTSLEAAILHRQIPDRQLTLDQASARMHSIITNTSADVRKSL